MASTRKTPQTWIDAGLKVLPKDGPDGLRAETLSRSLGATKGSFYWHFKDVAAFHKAVLADWQESISARLDAAVNSADTPTLQLRALAKFRPSKLDRAVRAWAVFDKQAARAVAKADADAIQRLTGLLHALEATHPDFPALIHAAMIASPDKGDHAETLVDLLLVLK